MRLCGMETAHTERSVKRSNPSQDSHTSSKENVRIVPGGGAPGSSITQLFKPSHSRVCWTSPGFRARSRFPADTLSPSITMRTSLRWIGIVVAMNHVT
eukprot:3396402-Rhodomonas_salina.2